VVLEDDVSTSGQLARRRDHTAGSGKIVSRRRRPAARAKRSVLGDLARRARGRGTVPPEPGRGRAVFPCGAVDRMNVAASDEWPRTVRASRDV